MAIGHGPFSSSCGTCTGGRSDLRWTLCMTAMPSVPGFQRLLKLAKDWTLGLEGPEDAQHSANALDPAVAWATPLPMEPPERLRRNVQTYTETLIRGRLEWPKRQR